MPCPIAPRPVSFRRSASPRSFAARGRSSRRTSRMNTSPYPRSRNASLSCTGLAAIARTDWCPPPLPIHLLERKAVNGRAEFAGDGDHPVLEHVGAVFGGEALEHLADPLARAAAVALERRCGIDRYAVLMIEAIQ